MSDTPELKPCPTYRAGIIEGIKLAFDRVDGSYDSNRMALFNSYGYHEEVLNVIDALIKEYAGEKDES